VVPSPQINAVQNMPTSKSNSDTTFSNEPQRIPQTPYEQRNGIPLLILSTLDEECRV